MSTLLTHLKCFVSGEVQDMCHMKTNDAVSVTGVSFFLAHVNQFRGSQVVCLAAAFYCFFITMSRVLCNFSCLYKAVCNVSFLVL